MVKNKIRIVSVLGVLLASFLFETALFGAESITPLGNSMKSEPGGSKNIPVIELPMPVSEQGKEYLSLSGTGNFKIGQIKAQVLIIEVYSIYCPHCQRTASQVNDLFRLIQERPNLKEKIKIIGIGANNSSYEVNSYQERYKVPFPLFPDLSMEITQKLDVRGTPTFIGLKVNDKGIPERFYFSEGGFNDAQQFLKEIIQLSELK